MAIIGIFTKTTNGSFTGKIQTLTISTKVTMQAADTKEGGSDKAPSHRITAGDVDLGAAWMKTSNEGRVYYSVKLDDPSFAQPVFASLVDGKRAGEYDLIWTRPGAAKHG